MQRRIFKRPRTYFDSVTLMRISTEAQRQSGVVHVAVVMATEMNKTNLEQAGFDLAEIAELGPNDLVIAVAGEADAIERAEASVTELLSSIGKDAGEETAAKVHTLDAALARLEGANLAIISTPGAFASREVMKALSKDLSVMLFSDNVPIEKEVAMKEEARRRGLLVMGPDCGTVLLHGKPLGFANVVRRGDIGLVAASGTGLQEVTCLVHLAGGGVSHAIGTGGRDLSEEVGGITMLQGIDLLEQDPTTKVIVLLSKPPAATVMSKLLERVSKVTKPCVIYFLGANAAQEEQIRQAGATVARTMEETALHALALASEGQRSSEPAVSVEAEVAAAAAEVFANHDRSKMTGRYLRGLFSGGTLCGEALLTLQDMLGTVYSNIAKKKELLLTNPLVSQEHTLIDMGEDFFTQNRPHPMIDVRYRVARIAEEVKQADVAVILFDAVIGYGSNPDPGGALAEIISQAKAELQLAGREVVFVGSVTGTDEDPQVRTAQIAKLEAAGAIVLSTNYRAARLAGHLIQTLKEVRA